MSLDNQQEPLNKLAEAAANFVKSERRSRWFGNFMKLAIGVYLIGSVILLSQSLSTSVLDEHMKAHVAVVHITGAIMPETATSSDEIVPQLQDAFKNEHSKAVILQVNSPGGSAVQSGLIYDEIKRLKSLYPNKPIVTVAEDLCASGCYYIASATDKIYADKASIIGSIGVRFDSFGVTQLMEKVGVENRSLSAGEHKRLLDPFSPADIEAQKHLQTHVLARTHEQFKKAVRDGRGDRLKETPELFTGLVWIGDEAVSMGLIDGLGDIRSIARNEFGEETLIDYAPEKSILDKLAGGIGTELATKLQQTLQTGVKFSL
jgi:protease-4